MKKLILSILALLLLTACSDETNSDYPNKPCPPEPSEPIKPPESLEPHKLHKIESEGEFAQTVFKSKRNVMLVLFCADWTKHCAPYKAAVIHPLFKQQAKVLFFDVNGDKERDITATEKYPRLHADYYPTTYILKREGENWKTVSRLIGTQQKEVVELALLKAMQN